MPLSLSNPQTLAVLDWFERDPERGEHLRAAAARLAPKGVDRDLRRLKSLLSDELHLELPQLEGVAVELLKSGANRVNFFELALALLTDAKPLDVTVITEERSELRPGNLLPFVADRRLHAWSGRAIAPADGTR